MSTKSPPPLPISTRPTWEYKLIEESPSAKTALESKLNILGRDGCEVVGMVPNSPASYRILITLKRRQAGR